MIRDIPHTQKRACNANAKFLDFVLETSFSYINLYAYTVKASLNRPTMGPTLNGPFRQVVGLGSSKLITMVLYERSFGTRIKRSI